ncbi:MAG: hypothetical protein H0X24_04515 [Ktedonobacterales bacterium]|nr:hypothetical protein [Ktedonobacterales bacterium]
MPADSTPCPECGAAISGGREGCQAQMDALNARARSDVRYASTARLAFDTYCMQHPATYCVSAKSYAAHLMGLCCGVDFAGNPVIYTALQRWLNGSKALTKPPVPPERGSMTVRDVAAATTPQTYAQAVQHWAATVWADYQSQHALAHDWIAAALAADR